MAAAQPGMPAASPPPGGQGGPPMGVSPASGPTPNKGYEAAGLQKIGMIVKQLEQLIPLLGASSDAGGAALKALNSLAKFVPAGSVTPAAEKNSAEQMMMQAVKNNQQMQAMKQGGAPGGAPPGGPPQGMPQGAAA